MKIEEYVIWVKESVVNAAKFFETLMGKDIFDVEKLMITKIFLEGSKHDDDITLDESNHIVSFSFSDEKTQAEVAVENEKSIKYFSIYMGTENELQIESCTILELIQNKELLQKAMSFGVVKTGDARFIFKMNFFPGNKGTVTLQLLEGMLDASSLSGLKKTINNYAEATKMSNFLFSFTFDEELNFSGFEIENDEIRVSFDKDCKLLKESFALKDYPFLTSSYQNMQSLAAQNQKLRMLSYQSARKFGQYQ